MSEIEKASRINLNVFIVYIFLLVIAALFSAWVFISGKNVQDLVRADADARISAAQTEATKANSRADELKLNILGMEKEVAEAKKKQADAERRLIEIQESMKWRSFTDEQKATLISILKENLPGEVFIECPYGNPEAGSFAKQLADILKLGGWKVALQERVMYFKEVVIPKGLFLFVKDQHNPVAISLQYSLKQVGFLAPATVRNNPADSSEITLLVGAKP